MLSADEKALARGAEVIESANAIDRYRKDQDEAYNKLAKMLAKPTIRDKRRIERASKKRK